MPVEAEVAQFIQNQQIRFGQRPFQLAQSSAEWRSFRTACPCLQGMAGSGTSEIRRYVIEGDLVEAVIQLPTDLFYNTGISTYIWVITKGKPIPSRDT